MKINPIISLTVVTLFFSAFSFAGPGMTTEAFAQPEITLSGLLRVRPEMRENADFNSDKDDAEAFWGSRTQVNINVKFDDDTSAKITLQDARNWSGQANNVSSSLEKEAVDIFEAYFQANNIKGIPIGVKLGRQTLVYGDQRLLGHLGWKDFGRTHDALKVMLKLGPINLDLITAKENESGKPSDELHDDDLNVLYATTKIGEYLDLDAYAMQWKTAGANSEGKAIQGKNIMTMGARAALKKGAIDATGEFVIQSGDWAKGVTHNANAMSFTAGYTLGILGGTRAAVEYHNGSGDENPNDKDHQTFVFPFHTNHAHYGFMDYFSWGNMQDVAIRFSSKPVTGLTVKVDYHMFSLNSAKDDWLNVVGNAAFKPAVEGKKSLDAGSELDFTAVYGIMQNWKIVAGYSMFLPGEAAKDRSGGKADTSTWGYMMSVFKF